MNKPDRPTLRDLVIEKLMAMDLGYRWQMSEIASSALMEQKMEADGIKEVNKTADSILKLIEERIPKEKSEFKAATKYIKPSINQRYGNRELVYVVRGFNACIAEMKKEMK